jgi:hypothetical protein
MTISPYELLARFNRDGTIAGVSVRTLTTFDDGTERENNPTPLAGASDPAFAAFASQFSAAVVAERDALAAAKANLAAELATMTTDRDSQRTAKESALADVTRLTGELADANAVKTEALRAQSEAEAELATRTADRDTKQQRIEELEAELDALRNPPPPTTLPLTASVVFSRAGNRFIELLAAHREDAVLLALFIRMAAATLPLDVESEEVQQGMGYLLQREYATEEELDVWFAPGTP